MVGTDTDNIINAGLIETWDVLKLHGRKIALGKNNQINRNMRCIEIGFD